MCWGVVCVCYRNVCVHIVCTHQCTIVCMLSCTVAYHDYQLAPADIVPSPPTPPNTQLKRVGEVLREVGSSEGCGGWTATTDAELDNLLQRMRVYVEGTGAAAMTVLRRRRAAGMMVAVMIAWWW